MKYYTLFCFLVLVLSCNTNKPKLNSTIIESKTIIYGSGTCHYCIDTKAFFVKNEMPFVFYDLDKNPSKIQEMYTKLRNANISTSDFQIPVVDKGGQIFTNDYDSFEMFLNKLR